MDQQNTQGGNATKTPAGEQVKQQAKQVVDQGQQLAGQVVDKARGQVKGQITSQKDNISSTLESVAQALLLTSRTLREQGQDQVSQYGDRAAEQVARVSTYLKQRDIDQVMQEAAGLARRRPVLVLGTAVTLGVLAARFLKSSSQNAASGQETPSRSMVPYTGSHDGAGSEYVGTGRYASGETTEAGDFANVGITSRMREDDADAADASGVKPSDGL